MDTITIELPKPLTTELNNRNISAEQVRLFVVQAIEIWLRTEPEIQSTTDEDALSPFAESALPFIEQLIDENRELFERLAKL